MVSWLREGDRNIAFFHKVASGRRSRNTIDGILDENDVMCEDEEAVKHLFVDYFSGLFVAHITLVMEGVIEAVES
ncbi:hypothetical protein ACS0TY_014260 [Phlomoides rotata]